MIVLLIKLIFITSVLIIGWAIASGDGMVFYPVRQWAEKKKEEGYKIMTPLFLCVYCQSSIWSLFGFLIAYAFGIINHFNWRLFVLYILCVCGSSIVSGIIWEIREMLESATDRNKAQQAYYSNAEELLYWDKKDRKEEFKRKKIQ